MPRKPINQMTPEEREAYKKYYREYYLQKKANMSEEELKIHRDKVAERNKKYKEEHKETLKEKRKVYITNNQNKIKESWESYYQDNKESLNQKNKDWFIKNPNYRKEYKKKRRDCDITYKFKENLRNLIKSSFRRKNLNKNSKTEQILGCTFEEFKTHIENQFEPWMNWDNYGLYNGELNYGWDIDHITPLNSDKTIEGTIKLNHYTNLQPLCSKMNRDIKRFK